MHLAQPTGPGHTARHGARQYMYIYIIAYIYIYTEREKGIQSAGTLGTPRATAPVRLSIYLSTSISIYKYMYI